MIAPRRPEKPRLGPWLRSYGERPRRTWRDRLPELLAGLAATLVFAALLIGVLTAFLHYPVHTFAALVAIWLVGLVVLLARQRGRRRRL